MDTDYNHAVKKNTDKFMINLAFDRRDFFDSNNLFTTAHPVSSNRLIFTKENYEQYIRADIDYNKAEVLIKDHIDIIKYLKAIYLGKDYYDENKDKISDLLDEYNLNHVHVNR